MSSHRAWSPAIGTEVPTLSVVREACPVWPVLTFLPFLSSVWFLHALLVLWIHVHNVSFPSRALPLGNPSGRVSCPFPFLHFPVSIVWTFLFYDSSYLALWGENCSWPPCGCSRHSSFESAFNTQHPSLFMLWSPLIHCGHPAQAGKISPLSPHHSSEFPGPLSFWRQTGVP